MVNKNRYICDRERAAELTTAIADFLNIEETEADSVEDYAGIDGYRRSGDPVGIRVIFAPFLFCTCTFRCTSYKNELSTTKARYQIFVWIDDKNITVGILDLDYIRKNNIVFSEMKKPTEDGGFIGCSLNLLNFTGAVITAFSFLNMEPKFLNGNY